MADYAIEVDDVYKDFTLPHERKNSVKSIFTSVIGNSVITSKTTQHALHDISFEVKKGEFFGIVGRNGSGKSTLLKILANIYVPTKGRVKIHGKLVPFIELGVGFNPELTGRENVYLNGAIIGFSEREINEQYDKIVEFAELEKFMDQKLKNYSSGMQVRLAFSCATMSEADILLVDEVLAVGDADFQRKCFDYFRKLKKEQKTVVFVSHDMGAIREYCDRAILIEDTKIVMGGTSNQVANEYIRLFIPDEHTSGQAVESERAKRYGSGELMITSLNYPKRVTPKMPVVVINVSCKAKQDIEDPIIGIKITDPQDRPLLGTNTKLGEVKLGSIAKGEKINLSFSVDNIFNEGEYVVSIAVESQDQRVFDWWEDAFSFRVFKEKKTGYPIEPKFKIEYEIK